MDCNVIYIFITIRLNNGLQCLFLRLNNCNFFFLIDYAMDFNVYLFINIFFLLK